VRPPLFLNNLVRQNRICRLALLHHFLPEGFGSLRAWRSGQGRVAVRGSSRRLRVGSEQQRGEGEGK
jgi:hypothetical protein